MLVTYPRAPEAPTRHCTRSVAVHPICGSAPDLWQCTRSEEVQCLRIGCSAPINKPKRGIYRSTDATTSKLHEGRRRVELNREMSRRANPLLCGGRRGAPEPLSLLNANPLLCEGRRWDRRARAGFEARHRAKLGRLVSRTGRRPRRTKQPGPAPSTPPAPGKQPGHTATNTITGAQATGLRPLSPLREESQQSLTAWRPRS